MKNVFKALFISTLITGVSLSQAGGMPFADMDTNKNGTVSEQEFNTAKAKHIETRALQGRKMRGVGNAPVFADFDANKNGELTREEVQAVQQARMQSRAANRMGKGLGKGMGNGMRKRGNQPVFSDFDANADNYITKQEFYDARNKRIAERAKQGFAMRGLATAPAFDDVDSNGDGKVSQDEFMSQRNAHMQDRHRQQK